MRLTILRLAIRYDIPLSNQKKSANLSGLKGTRLLYCMFSNIILIVKA
jgi:hypothetical protein